MSRKITPEELVDADELLFKDIPDEETDIRTNSD